jgi:uncharacterized protein
MEALGPRQRLDHEGLAFTTLRLYYTRSVVKLYGRAQELRALSAAWDAASRGIPQLVLVTGRRRVGKSFLLGHFSAGCQSVMHVATRESMPLQLARLGEQLNALAPAGSRYAIDSWHDVFAVAAQVSQLRPLLLVIDEVPYLQDVDSAWGSILQSAWDRITINSTSNLMIVLSGSSRRVMESLTSGSGPLYGRPTLRLRVDPIPPEEISAFLPRTDPTTRFEVYAATGGYPMHLLAWDPDQSSMKNVQRLAGSPGSILYENARLILGEEFPSGVGYERILSSIGIGRRRFGDISSDAGLRIEGPLATLESIGVVEAERPVGAPRKTHPLYRIADPYLAFWFDVVSRVRTAIELGSGEAALVLNDGSWRSHVAATFEASARRFISKRSATGDLPLAEVGRWWGKVKQQQVEVDAVGLAGSRCEFVGEVKWQAAALTSRDLRDLKARGGIAFGEDDSRLLVTVSRGQVDKRAVVDHHRHFSIDDVMGDR